LGKKDSDELMQKLRVFVRTRGAEYLKDNNISSVGIGYKVKDGKPTKEITVQFTVSKKVEPDMLESLNTIEIPKSIKIGKLDVPTDVIERKFVAEYMTVSEEQTSNRKTRIDPIVPGISVSNVKGSAGTIGCIVYDRADGTPYILSNWHVLHGHDGIIGDDVVQPGPYDDNRIHLNQLGKLVRSHLGHAGDCAVSTIDDRDFCPDIIDLGVIVDKLGEPELGDMVVKSGRTTGVTHGIVSRVDTIVKINYGGSTGEQEVGGFEIELDPDNIPHDGEVSKPGDSGSVWLFKSDNGQPSKIMAGLHFAGEGRNNPHEHAIACYPKSVFKKLEISLQPSDAERVSESGFAQDFLSFDVGLPDLSARNSQDAFILNESEVIDYTHFSLALNKTRKFAFWVAWNVDGGHIRRLSRKGISFALDPRIPSEFQAGEKLYAGNNLDRGHIARRADLVWGNLAEAKKANKESFFFPNIAPQMDDFNRSNLRGVWGLLENAVFDDTEVEGLRINVLSGPVFSENDRSYRGVKIPHEFWKVIVFVENQELKAKGFMLTQNLDQIEAFELDEFRVFQVGLSEIEERCGLTFDDILKSADSIGERLSRSPEALDQRKPIEFISDIDWS